MLPYLAAYEHAIETGCALLLVALGAWMLVGQLRPGDALAVPKAAAHAFLPTFLLTVVNPMTFVMFAGVVPQLPVAGSVATASGLALALAAGSATINVAIGGCGAILGRALPGERARRAVSAVAAAGVLAFGLWGLAAA